MGSAVCMTRSTMQALVHSISSSAPASGLIIDSGTKWAAVVAYCQGRTPGTCPQASGGASSTRFFP
jgi:hypothetical protein